MTSTSFTMEDKKPEGHISITEITDDPQPPERVASRRFFPFYEEKDEEEHPQAETSKGKRAPAFPWMGLIGVVGALLTVLFSWVLLFCIDDRDTWTKWIRVTPNSILSAILSLNSVFIHLALNEGINIAWWYRATCKQTTMKDLHRTWEHSTSLWSAVTSGKRFSYVGLAVVIVAILPLNGFILQGAVTVSNDLINSTATVHVPFAPTLKSGWVVDSEGSVDRASRYDVSHQVNVMSYEVQLDTIDFFLSNPFFGEGEQLILNSGTTGCNGTCKFMAPGFGFHTTCKSWRKDYDLTLQTYSDGSAARNQPMVNDGVDIYSIYTSGVESKDFSKTVRSDKSFQINVGSKTDFGCKGSYEMMTCTLEAAIIDYPTVLISNNTNQFSSGFQKPMMWLDTQPLLSKNTPNYPVVRILSEEEWKTWHLDLTEIWYAVQQTMGSSIHMQATIDPKNASDYAWTYSRSGPYSTPQQVIFDTTDTANEFSQKHGCAARLEPRYIDLDVPGMIITTVNKYMWYLNARRSVYTPEKWESNFQYLHAHQADLRNRYHVSWVLWGGSLAITLIIIAVVVPIFWGFWRLVRKTTMSPVETSRVFHGAVGIGGASPKTHTKTLLEQYGHHNVREHHRRDVTSDRVYY